MKNIILLLATLLLTPGVVHANDMTAIQYIFTAALPAFFVGISALVVMSLAVYLYNREGHDFLRKSINFLVYASYAVTVVAFFMTMGVSADPRKNDIWEVLLQCFAVMGISCVFMFITNQAVNKPSRKGLRRIKYCLVLYFILIIARIIGSYV